MLKYFFVFIILFTSSLLANTLQPSYIYKADGSVTDIISQDDKIMVSTNVGTVNIFDIKTKKDNNHYYTSNKRFHGRYE